MRVSPIVVGLVFSLVAGCGSEVDRIPLTPVAGKVTLDGKPLEGAQIAFVADPSNANKTDGTDVTGADGSFAVKYRNRPGVAAGKYKIVVAQPAGRSGSQGKMPDDIASDPLMVETSSQAVGTGGRKPPAPWPYGDVSKTPLTHEVGTSADTDLTFDLKSTLK